MSKGPKGLNIIPTEVELFHGESDGQPVIALQVGGLNMENGERRFVSLVFPPDGFAEFLVGLADFGKAAEEEQRADSNA
jgi:hypothetical protein